MGSLLTAKVNVPTVIRNGEDILSEKLKAKAFVEKYFQYKHLAPHLQEASRPFALLAGIISQAEVTDEEQREIALQKILEAKDCFVRSCLMINKPESILDKIPQEELDKINVTHGTGGR